MESIRFIRAKAETAGPYEPGDEIWFTGAGSSDPDGDALDFFWDFDASDGSRARLICLLLTPQENSMAQLELLQLVGDTFDQPEKRNAVLHASNETEMLAGLRLGEAPITPNEAEGAK